MSLERIHLRKLIKLLYLPANKRRSALRQDIRDDIAREAGATGSGGDFYGPFWSDAKGHVFGWSDLHDMTQARIAANSSRLNLYPQLRDGFLLWWNERRRWSNEPFRQADAVKAAYNFAGLGTVKIANVLCVRDGNDENHFVYPYWFPEPVINEEAARLSLWMLGTSLTNASLDELRLLDVIRGRTFSTDRTPLQGDEQHIFQQKYERLRDEWNVLRLEY